MGANTPPPPTALVTLRVRGLSLVPATVSGMKPRNSPDAGVSTSYQGAGCAGSLGVVYAVIGWLVDPVAPRLVALIVSQAQMLGPESNGEPTLVRYASSRA